MSPNTDIPSEALTGPVVPLQVVVTKETVGWQESQAAESGIEQKIKI